MFYTLSSKTFLFVVASKMIIAKKKCQANGLRGNKYFIFIYIFDDMVGKVIHMECMFTWENI